MTDQILERITVAEFAKLPETTHITELLDAVVYVTASPKDKHQQASFSLVGFLNDLKRQGQISGTIRFAPMDVYLDDYNVPQPDVFFVRSDNTRCVLGADDYWHGPPDLVVEVLSPGTARRDKVDKFKLYEKHGIREYWIVEPTLLSVEVWVLTGTEFELQGTYSSSAEQHTFTSPVLDGLSVDLKVVFS